MRLISSLLLILLPFLVNASNLFYFSPEDGKGGLRLAVKNEKDNWEEIDQGFNFVSSDFGAWGSGKKMFDPILIKDDNGWTLIFAVNKPATIYGIAESSDLINWKPQEYISANDFEKNYSALQLNNFSKERVGKHHHKGRTIDVDDSVVKKLKEYVEKKKERQKLYSEKTKDDQERFKGLKNLSGTLKVSSQTKDISPILLGIFFEDINYASDGGLYAELIQNRDFEYRRGESHNKDWGPDYGWVTVGKNIHMRICDENSISTTNPHYARLTVSSPVNEKSGLVNEGFDGISLKAGDAYKFSLRGRSDSEMPLEIELLSHDNKIIASSEITIRPGKEWREYSSVIHVDENYSKAKLKISPRSAGVVDLDMISLFPSDTYKGRENGLRKDLAETLESLKPRFVRFPGGCVAHGNGLDNTYDWKGSIGSLEERKPLSNLWGYHQTRGLGYHEYFLFCEDIGAEPVPVLAAGVPCQNSSSPSRFTVDDLTRYGQQQGLPMDSIDSYIQDILDLIEYANGPTDSFWGSKRAAAGHPQPFGLKYIGIGNEDMITEVFKDRFSKIHDAVKSVYPEITVIGTTGPFYEGADYEEGWRFAREKRVDMVDEHYYVEPGWLIYNQDFYDDYDRTGPKVYLGEWAAHLPDRSSTIETALAEAIYITSLERNGDVVRMSSYAPLLAKKNHTQWRPDLIYFDNDSVYPTPDFHVMRLAGEYAGDKYLNNVIHLDNDNEKVKARIGASVVKDSESGQTFIKLVNMLPVETNISIDLSEALNVIDRSPENYKVITLKGNPSDVEADIFEEVKTDGSPLINLNLSPYSFTIIKI